MPLLVDKTSLVIAPLATQMMKQKLYLNEKHITAEVVQGETSTRSLELLSQGKWPQVLFATAEQMDKYAVGTS